ncbi:MAG: hypothetical protein IJT24_06945 [Lachnospiraceae bacterium]|nr:hypothetical protein [Lachnospiraceae bacterium]
MSENNDLFRKKSLESITAPEQMNDYVKVIGPGVWIVIAAVIILLSGVIVWGVFGRLETTDDTVSFVDGGLAVCYVDKETAEDIDRDSSIRIGGELTDIVSVSPVPIQASSVYDAGTLSDMGLTGHDMLYPVTARSNLPNGSYDTQVIVEQIHPMSFVTGAQD